MIKDGHYYYDVRENLMRHTDCVLFFAVGVRDAGKTYSARDRAVKKYFEAVEKKESIRRFIWLRTLDSNIKITAKNDWFKVIREKYPDHTFEIKSLNGIRTAFIDGEIAGHFLSCRQWENLKGVEFPDVECIYYDEFLSKTTRREKNFNPVTAFQGLINSINRRRDGKEAVKAVLMANQISYNNEFFRAFGINIPQGYTGIFKIKGLGIAVEMVYDKAFAEKEAATVWGKIFMTNEYGQHAIENKSLMIADGFIIDKKPSNLHLMFTLQYFDSYIYIYEDLDEKIFVEESRTPPPKNIKRLGLRYDDSEKYEIPYFEKYASGAYRNIILKSIHNNNIAYVGRDVKEILLQNI